MSRDAVSEPLAPRPIEFGSLLPKPVVAVCVLLIVAGAILLLTRPGMVKSSTYEAMQNCDATTFKPMRERTPTPIEDGFNELYGVIHIKGNKPELARLFTYCETEPALALDVYRRAMTQGNFSAKTIAAYSSFFLASRGVFEASDFELLRNCLKPGEVKDGKDSNVDLRKVAQRAVSDLTAIKSVKDVTKYEELPPNMSPRGSEEVSRAIKTRTDQLNGQEVLCVRWSSANVADAWWAVHGVKGAWDASLKRFVIP
jgi:hypothetical protein